MTLSNLSVNVDKNIARGNSSEKSHDITTIDFSVNKELNKTKLNDINKTSCSSNIPGKRRNIRSKIPENKKVTNQLRNIRKIKHHLHLQNCMKIQSYTSKDIRMALLNNLKNSIRISITEHLTKSINNKTKIIEMLNSAPAKDVTEETIGKSFYNKFDKKDQDAATTALKEKVKNQTSENQNREKEEVDKDRNN